MHRLKADATPEFSLRASTHIAAAGSLGNSGGFGIQIRNSGREKY